MTKFLRARGEVFFEQTLPLSTVALYHFVRVYLIVEQTIFEGADESVSRSNLLQAIRDRLLELKVPEKEKESFKILLCGASGIGKTEVIHRLFNLGDRRPAEPRSAFEGGVCKTRKPGVVMQHYVRVDNGFAPDSKTLWIDVRYLEYNGAYDLLNVQHTLRRSSEDRFSVLLKFNAPS